MQRARFRAQIFDWKGALKDIDTLLANRATADLYLWRSSVLVSLDRNDQAIAAAQTSYELDPSNGTAFFLAELLAYQNKRDEALALLDHCRLVMRKADSMPAPMRPLQAWQAKQTTHLHC